MGRTNLSIKKRVWRPRYRIGDRLYGFNDGPKEFYLYKNVVQPVTITKLPEFPGDEYQGNILGFTNGSGTWWEDALCEENDYRYAPDDLKKNDYIEFKMGKRYREDGDLISDVSDTWIAGRVVKKMGKCHYQILRTL